MPILGSIWVPISLKFEMRNVEKLSVGPRDSSSVHLRAKMVFELEGRCSIHLSYGRCLNDRALTKPSPTVSEIVSRNCTPASHKKRDSRSCKQRCKISGNRKSGAPGSKPGIRILSVTCHQAPSLHGSKFGASRYEEASKPQTSNWPNGNWGSLSGMSVSSMMIAP